MSGVSASGSWRYARIRLVSGMNDRWSSSGTLADSGRGRPRSALTRIFTALFLGSVLVLLALSFAGWVVMSALSMLVLAVVTQMVRSFEFVVPTGVKPPRAERAIRDVMRQRAMWSPLPLVRARVVESVGGSNIHVHQRPRLFWFCIMLETAMLYAGIDDDIYLTLLIVEGAIVTAGLLWSREWLTYLGENA